MAAAGSEPHTDGHHVVRAQSSRPLPGHPASCLYISVVGKGFGPAAPATSPEEGERAMFDLAPYREAIGRVCAELRVRSLALVGSAARADFDPARSDVDLLVVVPTSEQEAFNALMRSVDSLAAVVRGRYGFPLSPVTMTVQDFEVAFREKKRIAQDVLNEGIVLFGEERYYQLLAKVLS